MLDFETSEMDAYQGLLLGGLLRVLRCHWGPWNAEWVHGSQRCCNGLGGRGKGLAREGLHELFWNLADVARRA